MSEPDRRGGSEKGDCPACSHQISKALASRGTERRRQCLKCRARWLTTEVFVRRIAPGEPDDDDRPHAQK
jgi:hypothetical protein